MRKKRYFRRAVYELPDKIFVPERSPKLFRKWLQSKQQSRPLHVELGMGMGDFLVETASRHPGLFFVGVEIKPDRIFRAAQKAQEKQLENIVFLQTPVERLIEYSFPTIQQLYLFFSDPWPKEKHEHRRMTSQAFLMHYEQLLSTSGKLALKTDNKGLFTYSKQSMASNGWNIVFEDEHYKTDLALQSQFERKFLDLQQPIYYLETMSPKPPFSFRKTLGRLVNSFSSP